MAAALSNANRTHHQHPVDVREGILRRFVVPCHRVEWRQGAAPPH